MFNKNEYIFIISKKIKHNKHSLEKSNYLDPSQVKGALSLSELHSSCFTHEVPAQKQNLHFLVSSTV